MTNLSQNQKVVKFTKKIRREKETERNETNAVKWNKRWGPNTYHEMKPFIVFKCNKERYEIFTEAATGSALQKQNVLKNFANFTGKHLC